MTVSELIEKLKTMPPDATVLVSEQTYPMDAVACEMFGDKGVMIC